MVSLYGPGLFLAKTDLALAFRQLFLALSEWIKVVYFFAALYQIDCRDVWGTRAGSAHTQKVGQMIVRIISLILNGLHLRHDVDAEIEDVDYLHFKDRLTGSHYSKRQQPEFKAHSI